MAISWILLDSVFLCKFTKFPLTLRLIGALAAVCFHLHWVKGKDSLESWHTTVTLRNITHVGFVSGVIGSTLVIWYLFLTFYNNIREYGDTDIRLAWNLQSVRLHGCPFF